MTDLPIVAPGYGDCEPEYEDLRGCLSNSCVIDRSVLTEAVDSVLRRPFFRVLRVLEPALIALCLGMLIWTLATKKGTGPAVLLGFVLLFVAVLYVWQFWIYPRRTVKQLLINQALSEGSTALPNRLYFTDANVANRRGSSRRVLHMGYDRIKRISETPRLIVLTTRRRHLIPLDKAGFENGTPEDLWKLMAHKAPNAKTERR